MRHFSLRLVCALVIVTIAFTTGAFAGVTIQVVSTLPSLTDELTVNLTHGVTGAVVTGTTTSPGVVVDFSTPASLDSLIEFTDFSAPRVEAVDDSIDIMTVSVEGHSFGDFIGNVFGVYDQDRSTLSVVVNASDGVHTMTFPMNVGQDSNNYLQVVASGGVFINSIQLGTDANPTRFFSLRDVNVSSPVAPVPEPASIFLVGAGLAGAWRTFKR